MNLLKSALQVELNFFFKAIHCADTAQPVITDSAFCQARKKLKYQAFIELDQEQVSYFYHHYPYRDWNGFRLLSVDGSTMRLPSNHDIALYFGGISEDGDCPLARVSQLYDLRNKVTVDAVISPYSIGERELSTHHMTFLTENDLVLFDRGYAAFWYFAEIRSTSAHFCARMNIDQWSQVDQFYQSGQKETIVTLSPSPYSLKICQEKNISTEPLTVRLIRVELENNEIEILMTSLTKRQKVGSKKNH